MGTHPIFESDFDCLTECIYNKNIKKCQIDEKGGNQVGQLKALLMLMTGH